MAKIVLTPQQVKSLHEAPDVVEFVDEAGRLLGAFKVTRFSEEDLARAKERAKSPGPWISSEDVMAHLHALGQH